MFAFQRAQMFKRLVSEEESNQMEAIDDNRFLENKVTKNGLVEETFPVNREPRNGNSSSKMRGFANKVKNATGAVTYMQKQTLRSRLRSRMRRIAEERLSVRQIFKRYVDQSTLHGFRYTCEDSYYVRRFVWACLMIIGAIYFAIKLKEGIIQYYSYPFSTLSTLEYTPNNTLIEFPAITLCSVNQFNKTRLKESLLYKLHLQHRLPLDKNWTEPDLEIPGEVFFREYKNVSINIDDIFKGCDWINRDTAHPKLDRRPCGSENYTTHFSESGQVCFTLNSGKAKHQKLEVETFGLKYGYEALFDFDNDDIIPYVDYTGFQVIVHDPNDLPTGKVGFLVSPGFKVFVDLQRTETVNLRPPYSTKCGEKPLKYFKVYNQKACLLERLTDHLARKCRCREFYMPDNGFPYCSFKQTITCAFPGKESFNKHKEREFCPIDCHVVEYETKVTETRFLHHPPIGIAPEIIEEFLMKQKLNYSHVLHLSKQMSNSDLDLYIEKNILKIIFFFGDNSKTVHTQEASFDFYQFLGDMGGEIGLMLGASLLTFVEFIDLICFLAYHQLLRLNNKDGLEEDTSNVEERITEL